MSSKKRVRFEDEEVKKKLEELEKRDIERLNMIVHLVRIIENVQGERDGYQQRVNELEGEDKKKDFVTETLSQGNQMLEQRLEIWIQVATLYEAGFSRLLQQGVDPVECIRTIADQKKHLADLDKGSFPPL